MQKRVVFNADKYETPKMMQIGCVFVVFQIRIFKAMSKTITKLMPK